jgi:hypothetical protein
LGSVGCHHGRLLLVECSGADSASLVGFLRRDSSSVNQLQARILSAVTDDADVIADLEAQRYQAMLRSDEATLDELCDDDLTYTHSDGACDTKATYLRRVRDGYFDYQRLEHEIHRTIVIGDCAVVVGRMIGDVVVNGSLRHLNSAALIVWVRRANGWRLLAFQPTPLPSAH